MKIKFNKFERIAGLFVLCAIMGVALTALTVAVKQGWFDAKVYYSTDFESADGLHQGTIVQMSGIRVGAVESVDLQADNKIRVHFYVLGKFQDRIREDSEVQLIRPFLIGERVIDINVGNPLLPVVAHNGFLHSIETTDFMTLMSGKKLNAYFGRIGGILENMQILVEAFADKKRAESLVRIFDRLDPLLKNMDAMSGEVTKLSKQVTHGDGVQKLIANLALTTAEINRILPELNKENPNLAKDLSVMTQNLALLTGALGPAISEVGPELPGASRRMVEALNETVITLKAMQKSFFMKSNVDEVRDEEATRRLPANHK